MIRQGFINYNSDMCHSHFFRKIDKAHNMHVLATEMCDINNS